MARVTKVVSFSLPPDTASKIESLAKSENRSRSELLREMVDFYERRRAEADWQELFNFGEETARRFQIKGEDELFKILARAV